MIGTDYAGIASVIAAVGASAATVIAAIANARISRVHNEVKTPNGDPRTPGQMLSDVADKVGAGEKDVAHG